MANTSKERLLQFIDFKGISNRKFYSMVGLSNGYLDKINSVGSEKLEKIIEVFPELNGEWVVSGKGEMLTKEGEAAVWKELEPTGPTLIETKIQEVKDLRLHIDSLNKLIKMQEERIAELKQQLKQRKT